MLPEDNCTKNLAIERHVENNGGFGLEKTLLDKERSSHGHILNRISGQDLNLHQSGANYKEFDFSPV